MIGNFIADRVKGKAYKTYPQGISRGILLHRKIDHYTDNHPIVQGLRKQLHPEHGKCAGIIVDLFYDYFLANTWTMHSNHALGTFIASAYQTLNQNREVMPAPCQAMLSAMIRHDWLSEYATVKGIRQSLMGIERRTSFPWPLASATDRLMLPETREWESNFLEFFKELQMEVRLSIDQSG